MASFITVCMSLPLRRRTWRHLFEGAQAEAGGFYCLLRRGFIEGRAILHGDYHTAVLDVGLEPFAAGGGAQLLLDAIGAEGESQPVDREPVAGAGRKRGRRGHKQTHCHAQRWDVADEFHWQLPFVSVQRRSGEDRPWNSGVKPGLPCAQPPGPRPARRLAAATIAAAARRRGQRSASAASSRSRPYSSAPPC